MRPPFLSGKEGAIREIGTHTLAIVDIYLLMSCWAAAVSSAVSSGQQIPAHPLFLRLSGARHSRAALAALGQLSAFPVPDTMWCDKNTSSSVGGKGWRQQDPPRKFRKSTPWLFWLWQLSSFLVLHWILLKWDWKNYLWKEITERWLNDCILRESTDLQGHLHYWFFPLIDSSSECKRAILH